MPPPPPRRDGQTEATPLRIDTKHGGCGGIDTHTKTDNVSLFPVAKVMVQLVTNQRAITIMAKHRS